MTLQRWISFLLCLGLLAGCASPPGFARAAWDSGWRYADLRLLDPADRPVGEADIIAAYARCTTRDFSMRLDLLEMDDPWLLEVSVEIDTPAQVGRDLRIISKPGRPPEVIGFEGQARVSRSQDLDAVLLRLPANKQLCSAHTRIWAWLTLSGQTIRGDEVGPFGLQAPPPAPAPLWIAFSNTLPAATPAQAMRRWNGAHTGPYGQRHGLRILLNAVENHRIPVTLLDLTTPASLAALDALNGLNQVRRLQAAHLLTLPQTVTGIPEMEMESLDFSRQVTREQHLRTSPFVYSVSAIRSWPLFTPSLRRNPTAARIIQGQRFTWTFPDSNFAASVAEPEVNETGLSRDLKLRLLQVALTPDSSDLVISGGSLPDSSWADSELANRAFEWVARHPWIRPLASSDLLTWRLHPRQPSPDSCSEWVCEIESDSYQPNGDIASLAIALRAVPKTDLTESTWQAFFTLTSPKNTPELERLQEIYRSHLEVMVAAVAWASSPISQASCDVDLDRNGSLDCVLDSPDVLATIEPTGGTLTFLALRSGSQTFQVTGSTAQFGVGLSEPRDWDWEAGIWADPYVIPGAFAAEGSPPERFNASVDEQRITLTSTQGREIQYEIEGNRLRVTVRQPGSFDVQIPLIVAPEARFERLGHARYLLGRRSTTGELLWGVTDGRRVQVAIQADTWQIHSFQDVAGFLRRPEDPDRQMPEGHYLPFPVALLRLHGTDQVEVVFSPYQSN